MFKKIFQPSPSRFSGGVSLLWRGNNAAILASYISQFFSKKNITRRVEHQNSFLFESARMAIKHALLASGVGVGDEVIVSSFTCAAVTYAVSMTGATVVYVDVNNDLTMHDASVMHAVNEKTKAILLQNTFGRFGLPFDFLALLRKKNILIVEDCALSIGSKVGDKALGSFGDIAIWSLEVSKTVTIGWGGVATVNNNNLYGAFKENYDQLKKISMFADFRRIIQLWISVVFISRALPGATYLWYFLYGTRIFRRSNNFVSSVGKDKMGVLSRKLFLHMFPFFQEFFEKTHENYIFFLQEIITHQLECPVKELESEFIVTPRISILLDESKVERAILCGHRRGVEVGRWFDECPPDFELIKAKVISSKNAVCIAKKIINFSCHWTLTAEELDNTKLLISDIALLK